MKGDPSVMRFSTRRVMLGYMISLLRKGWKRGKTGDGKRGGISLKDRGREEGKGAEGRMEEEEDDREDKGGRDEQGTVS